MSSIVCASASWGYNNCFFDSPTQTIYSSTNLTRTNIISFGVVRHRRSNAVYSNNLSSPTISRLFMFGGPPTVIGGVITIIINPIKSVLRSRLSAHIRQKLSKTIPPLTYFYTSTAVIFIMNMSNIITPIPSPSPRIIFCNWLFASFFVTMFGIAVVVHSSSVRHSFSACKCGVRSILHTRKAAREAPRPSYCGFRIKTLKKVN